MLLSVHMRSCAPGLWLTMTGESTGPLLLLLVGRGVSGATRARSWLLPLKPRTRPRAGPHADDEGA